MVYPSRQEILAVLEYSSDTGVFRWKSSRGGNLAGSIAGNLTEDGYLRLRITGKNIRAHRVAFFLLKGFWLKSIDHINGDILDNREVNLREATFSQNVMNRGIQKNNTSGAKGVTWSRQSKKWLVQIAVNRNRRYIGQFDDIELADLVSQAAREKYHGDFCNHGDFREIK